MTTEHTCGATGTEGQLTGEAWEELDIVVNHTKECTQLRHVCGATPTETSAHYTPPTQTENLGPLGTHWYSCSGPSLLAVVVIGWIATSCDMWPH